MTNNGAITITGYNTNGGLSVIIPASTNGYPVTSIAADAFFLQSSISNVAIPNSVTNIGEDAFFACYGLTNVTIPNSVTGIGDYAFFACARLTNITVIAANPNYASVGGVLFDKSLHTLIQFTRGLTVSYTIPNSVTSIGTEAFGGCPGLTSVTIPNSVTNIGDRAFDSCAGLTSVTIPNSVTNIGAGAFTFCTQLHLAYFQGNAPLVDGVPGGADTSVFGHDSGTVFYPAGTTGWDTNFGGWPTVAGVYQPQPAIGGNSVHVQSNRFNFTILWATNASVIVQASTNLADWTPIVTNELANGTSPFSDVAYTNYPARYYRVQPQ